MKLNNPTTFDYDGVIRALNYRGIDNPEGYFCMMTITAILWVVTSFIIVYPIIRKKQIDSRIDDNRNRCASNTNVYDFL